MVNVFPLCSDDPSLIPIEVSVIFFVEKDENKQNEAGVGPFVKQCKLRNYCHWFCIATKVPIVEVKIPCKVK